MQLTKAPDVDTRWLMALAEPGTPSSPTCDTAAFAAAARQLLDDDDEGTKGSSGPQNDTWLVVQSRKSKPTNTDGPHSLTALLQS